MTLRTLFLLLICLGFPPESVGRATEQPAGRSPQRAGDAIAADGATSPALDLSSFEPLVRQRLERAVEALADARQNPSITASRLADRHGQVGLLFHAYELFAPAEWYYRRAIESDPDRMIWSYYLAMVLQRTGRPAEAASHLERAMRLDQEGHAVRLRLAEVRLELGAADAAVALWRRVLDEHAECPRALAGLGQAALERGDIPAAVEHLERALAAAPQATQLHYPLGMAYRGAGDLAQARRHLERAGDRRPPPCDPWQGRLIGLMEGEKAYLRRATRHLKAGQHVAALRLLRGAVAINPQSARAWANLGVALNETGRRDEARRAFRKAVEIEPDHAVARTNLATMLAAEGELDQAIVEARAAVAADALHQPARFVLGRLLVRARQHEEALPHLIAAHELDPGHSAAWIEEAFALLDLGRNGEALVRLEEAHRLNPDSALLTLVLARLLAASPEPERRDGRRAERLALSITEPALLVPQLETVALALAEQGRCAAGVGWQRRAVEEATAAEQADSQRRLRAGLRRLIDGPPCRPDPPTITALYPQLRGD